MLPALSGLLETGPLRPHPELVIQKQEECPGGPCLSSAAGAKAQEAVGRICNDFSKKALTFHHYVWNI